MTKKYDIAVIGGGLVGLTQSLLLAQNGFSVLCLDAATINQQVDDRTTAISYGSSNILSSAGVWSALLPKACPIRDIHILEGKSSVLLDFDSRKTLDTPDAAFGWIIDNKDLKKALSDKISSEENITFIDNTRLSYIDRDANQVTLTTDSNIQYYCNLLIGADGRRSFVRKMLNIPTRQWNYNQTALVCIVEHQNPHQNIAIEHFWSDGPFAMLPMNDKDGKHRSSIVWSFHDKDVAIWKKNNDLLLTALNERVPDFYGELLNPTSIQFYPLTFNHAYRYIDNRAVLVGDAAHGIHPIAGQGLNLGLRDIEALTLALTKSKQNNQCFYLPETLEKYNKQRQTDTVSMAAATDLLNRLFSNNSKAITKIRKTGLRLIEKSNMAKLFFMKRAMGEK